MNRIAPSLEQMAELYIAITDSYPEEELDEKVMEARQESFKILEEAGSRDAD